MPIFTCRTPPSSVLIAKIMHRLWQSSDRVARCMSVALGHLASTFLSLRLSLACICGLQNTRYSLWTWIPLFSCSSLNQRCKRDSSLRYERARLFVRPVAMLQEYLLNRIRPRQLGFPDKAGTIQALYKSIEYNHSA